MANNKKGNRNNKNIHFSQKLILNSFLLNLLGFDNFQQLSDFFKNIPDGYNEDNNSYFYNTLVNSNYFEKIKINKNDFKQYDKNIFVHTKKINEKRKDYVVWKYFQWACLMFVEIYLHKYFEDKEKFLLELNNYKNDIYNERYENWKDIADYKIEDLNKVAVWNATGSGKTLLMHINYLQFNYYLEKYNKQKSINKKLLITPHESLSKQHLDDFASSQISAMPFNKTSINSLFSDKIVYVIEITKLLTEGGKNNDKNKSIPPEVFGEDNLVFIDEVHKGSGNNKNDSGWKKQREKLYKKGFAFEYSATLGQVVNDDTKLETEYSKATLFDYSYRWFYNDGYGKDYRILNLEEDKIEHNRQLYLTACLLTYYQQLITWERNKDKLNDFNIQKPLWIFVGSTVSATKENIESDVIQIVLFLAEFIDNKNNSSIKILDELVLNKKTVLEGIFANVFKTMQAGLFGEELFNDILKKVFNTSSKGKISLRNLKKANGEIELYIGNEDKSFGLINIGDDDKFLEQCKNYDEFFVSVPDEFTGSTFDDISKTKKGLNTNILIGSKKFVEGWNCYRVSTMGLMNIGKSEGSQIIQLFGRGIRLKGYNGKLKRSSQFMDEDKVKKNIEALSILETLNIFGVHASYMKKFKEELQREGLPTNKICEEIIPIKFNKLPTNPKLKTLSLKDGVDFKKQKDDDGNLKNIVLLEYKENIKINLDLYPVIDKEESDGIKQSNTNVIKNDKVKLEEKYLAFVDWQEVYFALQDYKAQKSWYNFNFNVENIKQLFTKDTWYTLYIREINIKSFADIRKIDDIVISLLKKYCETLYNYTKNNWEQKNLEYRDLSVEDNNFEIVNYNIFAEDNQKEFLESIRIYSEQIKNDIFVDEKDFDNSDLSSICFDKHLYNPILILNKYSNSIEVKPVPLNEGEGKFVKDLKKYCKDNIKLFEKEKIYLLRNRSKKGIGFFETSKFYPDFIMWHIKDDKQYITFIDPKGLRNLEDGQRSPKLKLYEKLKVIEEKLGNPNIKLNSIIISVTKKDVINWRWDMKKEFDFTEHHCLFQDDSNYIENIFKFNC